MGYDLHITRGRDSEDRGSPDHISIDEWRAFTEEQSDFRYEAFAEATNPAGETLRIEGPGLAVWTGHPSAEVVWFRHWSGRISVKNPDEVVLERMHEVAKAFGARIHGDEGELYEADGSSTGGATGRPAQRRPSSLRRLFRRR